jgi:hypothetical protein
MSPAGGGTRAIRTCTATTGFFVLERCDRNARRVLAVSARSASAHARAPRRPDAVCPERYAASEIHQRSE